MTPRTDERRVRLRYLAFGLVALVLALTVVGAAFASPSADSQKKNPPDAPAQGTPTPAGTATATPMACANYAMVVGTATIVPGTVDTGNHCDDCVTTIPLPFPYQLYGQTYTSVNLSSNGNAQFVGSNVTFANTCLPASPGTWSYTIFPYWDDLQTTSTGNGIFTTVEGTAPNRIFDIEWRAQYFLATGAANFELRLFEGQQTFQVIYGVLTNGNTSATGGVQGPNGLYTQDFCNGTGGPAAGSVTYSLGPCGTVTPSTSTPTRTPTRTPTPTSTTVSTGTPATATPTACSTNYSVTTGTATIVPGTVDTGNHCDDCLTTIPLPFPYQLYDQVYNSVNLSSNGNAQFTSTHTDFANTCLPVTVGSWNYIIFPYWDDLQTTGTGNGIFTTVEGTAPNRIFDIEWRATYFPGNGSAHFELRLYEGQQRFDVVFGPLTNGNTSATDGVQKDAANYTQYFCNGSGGPAVGSLTYVLGSCGTATATAQASATRTSVPTSTPTVPATVQISATPTAVASVSATAFVCNGRVAICHRTGNGEHHTITVSCNALPAHLAHGDTIGPCATETPEARNNPFQDVSESDYFYSTVLDLYDMGAVNGYGDGTFRPYNTTTRSQFVKMVVLAFNVPLYTGSEQHFSDVPSSNPFYVYVEGGREAGLLDGYGDGTFRPYNNVTRGQAAKITVSAAGMQDASTGTPTFSDVPVGSTFYTYIDTAYANGILDGYADHTFRPNADATRGQTSKIIDLATGFGGH